MIEDDTHDLLIKAYLAYFDANEKFEARNSVRTHKESRRRLREIRKYAKNGREKYFTKVHGKVEDSNKLAKEAADNIINKVGHDYIKNLDILEDDFNYSP